MHIKNKQFLVTQITYKFIYYPLEYLNRQIIMIFGYTIVYSKEFINVWF